MTALPLVLLIGVWFYSNNYYKGLAGMPRRYYDYNNWEGIVPNNNLTKVVLITFVLTALGFFTFLINLVIGLLKNSSITH
jgi:cytochrome c oxidase subunit 1